MLISFTKRLLLVSALLIALSRSVTAAAPPDSTLTSAYIMNVMHRVADWQLSTWNANGFDHPKVDCTNAACYTGI